MKMIDLGQKAPETCCAPSKPAKNKMYPSLYLSWEEADRCMPGEIGEEIVCKVKLVKRSYEKSEDETGKPRCSCRYDVLAIEDSGEKMEKESAAESIRKGLEKRRAGMNEDDDQDTEY